MLIMNKIKKIYYKENNKNIIEYENGKKECGKCINCKNKKCINYMETEINNGNIEIAKNINNEVCPNNAISIKNNRVVIEKEKCIGCGICVSRCDTGAIYMLDNKAEISEYSQKQDVNTEKIIKEGCIIENDNQALNFCYNEISKCNISPNIIARNLLISCGINTYLSRKGDVSLRMDGIIQQNNTIGVLEVEFGNEVLDCPRNILDDIAVLSSRYGYNKNEISALIVCYTLPNNRTDYWRVIKDIENILKVKIYTISIGGLLEILWNNKVIKIDELPFLNSEDNSLKNNIEKIIEKSISSDEALSIFETLK